MSGTVVEFLGLPGAGKTTLARSLGDELRAKGYPVAEPTDCLANETGRARRYATKAAATVRQGISHPMFTTSSLDAIGRPSLAAPWNWLRGVTNWQYVVEEVRGASARNPGSVTALDQGLAQALWSIGYMTTPDDISSFYPLLGQLCETLDCYVVVTVRTDDAAIQRRLRAREGSADHPFGPDLSPTDIARGRDLLESIDVLVDRVAEDGRLTTVTVKNIEDADLGRKTGTILEVLDLRTDQEQPR
jgi:hypothetical protein